MQSVEDFLDVLRCPSCGSDTIIIRNGNGSFRLPGIELADDVIHCSSCKQNYPISADGIPILWTPAIKDYLGANAGEGDDAAGTLSANIEVYDQISDHYLEHIRTNDADRDRILGCIRALEQKLAGAFPDGGWHIDIGCGPGHVLKWTQEWASSRKVKQIGLDVSMQNLRNTRRNTNAFVVLGDATCMPFKDGIAALVSEASVLHHIADWKACVAESCRIAHSDGAIVYDNEPTAASLDWSPLARRIFEGRFYGYHVLSYFMKSKRNFRNIALAKYNYYEAEVHNQPGRGFVPSEVEETFSKRGRDCKIYYRAGPDLQTGSGRNSLQMNFLLFMSTRDWRNPERGIMTLIAS